jgi:hypothetical protein
MTPDKEFEKLMDSLRPNGWALPLTFSDLHEVYDAATKRTAQRCVEICLRQIEDMVENNTGYSWNLAAVGCAQAIKEEFGL